jgi:hypothetical protein
MEARHITLCDGARSQLAGIAQLLRVVTVRVRSLHSVDALALRRLAEGLAAGPTARTVTTPRQRGAAQR